MLFQLAIQNLLKSLKGSKLIHSYREIKDIKYEL